MSSEVQAFIAKAKESLAASELLAVNELHDFAASRAYYTMFYIAEAFLWNKGLSFSSHAAVVSAFGREIAKPGTVPVQFHRYLLDAQDKRTQADYEVDTDAKLTADGVQPLIKQSAQFIQLAESILL
ncbi:MAG: HEPN domain-containing protein [Cyanobacteria bacterium P01_C01_bin.120]